MDAIDYLYAGREMTATELAEKAGVSPSAMSYHLRSLARWGVIERVGADTDARERRWRAAGDSLQIQRGDEETRSPAVTAAQAALVTSMIDQLKDVMLARLEDSRGFDEMVQFSTDMLLVNRAEFKTLIDEIGELTARFRAVRREAPEDAVAMRWNLIALPM
ncbi:MAG: MarR family transcriptional regulator [Mycobacteriales bacterium]